MERVDKFNTLHYKFWPKRLPYKLTPPATSLWYNLIVSAIRYPGKPAVVFFGAITTWAQLHERARRLAAKLQSLGVHKGDRVLVDMQNTPQLIIAHFAVLAADAIVVPINPMSKEQELAHYITDSGAKNAITTSDYAVELINASNKLDKTSQLSNMIVSEYTDAFNAVEQTDETLPERWRSWLLNKPELPHFNDGHVYRWKDAIECEDRLIEPTAGPDDLAVMPYTSGTTGLPKGCMHTHAAIMHNAVGTAMWANYSAESVVLVVAPMFHVTGIMSILHVVVYVGGTMVVMPRWDRDVAGRLITRWNVTAWKGVPTMVVDLFASPHFKQFDLSNLRVISGGGSAMPEAIAQRLLDVYGLHYIEGYGLTETASPSHRNPPDRTKKQCLGIPFFGNDARIVDPKTLQEVPQGESGEIVINGPELLKGYWNNAQATAEAFFELDGKRFFRTGDIGRIDADGYFFMTDRLKRMINASGFKVWPAEVESMMYAHPAIQEVCIISAKDSYRGETVKACVVLKTNFVGKIKEEEITDWCKKQMATYKAPRIVEFVEELPKTGSGKIMWRKLQEQENEGGAQNRN